MADLKANVGRILLGTKELAYFTGIEVDWDFNPTYATKGNYKLTITVDYAEYDASEENVVTTIAKEGLPITVQLLAGLRGGGIPTATFTNCVITNMKVTSRQGAVVKSRVILSKQSDS